MMFFFRRNSNSLFIICCVVVTPIFPCISESTFSVLPYVIFIDSFSFFVPCVLVWVVDVSSFVFVVLLFSCFVSPYFSESVPFIVSLLFPVFSDVTVSLPLFAFVCVPVLSEFTVLDSSTRFPYVVSFSFSG